MKILSATATALLAFLLIVSVFGWFALCIWLSSSGVLPAWLFIALVVGVPIAIVIFFRELSD